MPTAIAIKFVSNTPFRIIDDGKLRGIVAPAKSISRKSLDELMEIWQLSRPAHVAKLEGRKRTADKQQAWIGSQQLEREFFGKRVRKCQRV